MGKVKRAFQKLFGGGKRKNVEIEGDQGLGGEAQGLGMTGLGNADVLDQMGREGLKQARRDNPVGERLDIRKARRDNPVPEPIDMPRDVEIEDEAPIERTGPKYGDVAPRLSKYEGEFEDATWRPQGFNPMGHSTTEALDETERAKRNIDVDARGNLVSPTGALQGSGLFAMSPDGELAGSNYQDEQGRLDQEWLGRAGAALGGEFSDHQSALEAFSKLSPEEQQSTYDSRQIDRGAFHHASYFAGEDVAGAGKYRTDEEGTLKYLDADSGHHQPKTSHTMNVLHELQDRGANLDHTRVGVHNRDKKGQLSRGIRPFHSGEVLASEGNDQTLMAKGGMVHEMGKLGGDVRSTRATYKQSKALKKAFKAGRSKQDTLADVEKTGLDARKLDLDGPKPKLELMEDLPNTGKLVDRAKDWDYDAEEDWKTSPLRNDLVSRRERRKQAHFARRGDVGSDPTGEQKYKNLAHLGRKYEGEHTTAGWRGGSGAIGENERTASLTDEGRRRREVGVDRDGRLVRDGQRMDTTGSDKTIRDDMETEHHIFAMSPEGRMLSADGVGEEGVLAEQQANERDDYQKGNQHFHHSSFFGGRDLAGAGEMKVEDGYLKHLTPNSGHFLPETAQSLNVLDELSSRGANLDHTLVDVLPKDENGDVMFDDPKQFHAGEVMASEGNDQTLLGKRSFLDELKNVHKFSRKNEGTAEKEIALKKMIRDGASEEDVRAAAQEANLQVNSLVMDPIHPELDLEQDGEVSSKRLLRGAKSRSNRRERTYHEKTDDMFAMEALDVEEREERARIEEEEARKAKKREKEERELEPESDSSQVSNYTRGDGDDQSDDSSEDYTRSNEDNDLSGAYSRGQSSWDTSTSTEGKKPGLRSNVEYIRTNDDVVDEAPSNYIRTNDNYKRTNVSDHAAWDTSTSTEGKKPGLRGNVEYIRTNDDVEEEQSNYIRTNDNYKRTNTSNYIRTN